MDGSCTFDLLPANLFVQLPGVRVETIISISMLELTAAHDSHSSMRSVLSAPNLLEV